MRQIILASLLVAFLGAVTIADESQPATENSPAAADAKKEHDQAIKDAKEAYRKAVIAADEQYIADLDSALKQAMLNQDIDSARALDDQKKAAVVLLTRDQSVGVETDSSLIAFYPFNGNADDASGHQADGTLQNSPSFVDGPFGKGVQLVGQGQFGLGGQHVTIPPIDFSRMREFTVSLAANIEGNSSFPDGEGLIAFGSTPGTGLGVVDIGYGGPRNSGDLEFHAGGATVSPPMRENDWGQWHRYSMVYAKGVLTAYVDDQVVGTASGDVQSSVGNAGMGIHWWLNNPYGVSTRFVGSIADVRVYNRALGTDEISQLVAHPAP
jgi:Concanavalin A-like lectin/glucanases superfamily